MLDVSKAWKYSTGAGVTVGMIDTGVTPNPRFPALFPGGDYVMGDENGGLSDCDSHGTVVASIIAAQPSDPAAKPTADAGRCRRRRHLLPSVPAIAVPDDTAACRHRSRAPSPSPHHRHHRHRRRAASSRGARRAPRPGPGGGAVPPVPGPPPGSPDGVVGVAPDADADLGASVVVRVRARAAATRRQRGNPTARQATSRRWPVRSCTWRTSASGDEHLGDGLHQRRPTQSIRPHSVPPSATPRSTRTSSSWRPRATRARAPTAGRTRCSIRCGADDPRDWQEVSTIVTPGLVLRLRPHGRCGHPRRPAAAAEHRGSVGRRRGARPRDDGPVERQRCADQRAARTRTRQGDSVLRHQLRRRIHVRALRRSCARSIRNCPHTRSSDGSPRPRTTRRAASTTRSVPASSIRSLR